MNNEYHIDSRKCVRLSVHVCHILDVVCCVKQLTAAMSKSLDKPTQMYRRRHYGFECL